LTAVRRPRHREVLVSVKRVLDYNLEVRVKSDRSSVDIAKSL
jgi:hypothetical protein